MTQAKVKQLRRDKRNLHQALADLKKLKKAAKKGIFLKLSSNESWWGIREKIKETIQPLITQTIIHVEIVTNIFDRYEILSADLDGIIIDTKDFRYLWGENENAPYPGDQWDDVVLYKCIRKHCKQYKLIKTPKQTKDEFSLPIRLPLLTTLEDIENIDKTIDKFMGK